MPIYAKPLILGLFAAVTMTLAVRAQDDAAKPPPSFRMCMGCHAKAPDQPGAIGPYLGGIVGRKAGSLPGYEYSEAMSKSGLTWDEATLRAFLNDPTKVVPGTKKVIAVKNPELLDGVIVYLKTLK